MSKMYRINEFAGRIGCAASTVRCREHEGRLIIKRLPSGHRSVDESDVRAMLSGATHVVVNAASTSKMDSLTGRLEFRRVGDTFYRATGDVLQADCNAARNVKGRINDRGLPGPCLPDK